MDKEAKKPPVTLEELNRAIREEINQVLEEQRQEIVKRAHARLRAERSIGAKCGET